MAIPTVYDLCNRARNKNEVNHKRANYLLNLSAFIHYVYNLIYLLDSKIITNTINLQEPENGNESQIS